MAELLKFAEKGIPFIEPGIIPPDQYGTLKDNIVIPDRHYINILCMSALEAGYFERTSSGDMMMAKTTPKAEEFLLSNDKEKLEKAIYAVVKLCSSQIIQELPYLKNDFSEKGVIKLLKKPKGYDDIIKPVLKKQGLDLFKIAKEFSKDGLDEKVFLSKLGDDKKRISVQHAPSFLHLPSVMTSRLWAKLYLQVTESLKENRCCPRILGMTKCIRLLK
ncbi:MAG: hypothetical protein ACM3TR_19230 [Caulobacteraceae bacterium]